MMIIWVTKSKNNGCVNYILAVNIFIWWLRQRIVWVAVSTNCMDGSVNNYNDLCGKLRQRIVWMAASTISMDGSVNSYNDLYGWLCQ